MVYTNSPAMGMKSCPYCAEDIRAAAVRCKHCGSWLEGPPDRGTAVPPRLDPDFSAAVGPSKDRPDWPARRLYRSSRSRMLLGVCGGAAEYLGIDPTLLRLAFLAVWAFTAFVPMTLIYFLMALVIPLDSAESSW